MRSMFIRLLAGILAPALLGSCTGTQPRSGVREYLEEATGSTITVVTMPITFVSEQPGLASSGRDYIYLAPIVVNSGGERSCWLWLGVWSTIDRQARNEEASPLTLGTLRIVADDEPMDLEAAPADVLPPGLRAIPYETPVKPLQELLIPVTRSQVARLGRAKVLTLADRASGGASRLWQGEPRAVPVMSQFAQDVGR